MALMQRQPPDGPADLDGLKLPAAFDAAADVVDDLAQRRAHGHLDEAGVVDVAGQGESLCAGVACRGRWSCTRRRRG